jgi:hypothetical protein
MAFLTNSFLSDTSALIDLVLALVAAEAAGLYLLLRWTGRGPRYASLLANLAAGAALAATVRAALLGASYGVIAALLAVALAAHVADLLLRWRDAPRRLE